LQRSSPSPEKVVREKKKRIMGESKQFGEKKGEFRKKERPARLRIRKVERLVEKNCT